MKICLIISSMRQGGAERVMSLLANDWANRGHDVTLVSLDDGTADFYSLDARVSRIFLNQSGASSGVLHGILANLKRILRLRQAVKSTKPDVALSFLDATNLLVCMAMIRSFIPVVISERTDPFVRDIGLVRKIIRPFLYRYFAKCLVVQTRSVLSKCRKYWPGTNVVSLPNPVMDFPEDHREIHAEPILLSVGRLNNGKGFDVLIHAFSKLAPKFPKWRLRILGDGPDREKLESLVSDLKLQSRVDIPGSSKELHEEYARAGVFCLASRYEGFPNALLEALASGCACVATDCESGPREILEDGRLGLLVPVDDVVGLSNALATLMSSADKRLMFQANATHVRRKYKLEKISNQWLDLLDSVL